MSRYTFDNGYNDCYDDNKDSCDYSPNGYDKHSGFYGKNSADEHDNCSPSHKKREYRCFKEIPCPCEREEKPHQKCGCKYREDERPCKKQDDGCKRPCWQHDDECDDENQDCARINSCQRCRCGCIFPCLFCGRRR